MNENEKKKIVLDRNNMDDLITRCLIEYKRKRPLKPLPDSEKSKVIFQFCCFTGCDRVCLWDLGAPRSDRESFEVFCVYACEGTVHYSGESSLRCPRHSWPDDRCPILFLGALCPEHWDFFSGPDADHSGNIVTADPEMFDKRRAAGHWRCSQWLCDHLDPLRGLAWSD